MLTKSTKVKIVKLLWEMVDTQKIIVSLFYFGFVDPTGWYKNHVIVVSAPPRRLTFTGYKNRKAFAGAKHERVTLFMPLWLQICAYFWSLSPSLPCRRPAADQMGLHWYPLRKMPVWRTQVPRMTSITKLKHMLTYPTRRLRKPLKESNEPLQGTPQ